MNDLCISTKEPLIPDLRSGSGLANIPSMLLLAPFVAQAQETLFCQNPF